MIKIQIASPVFMVDERDLSKPLVEALSRAVPLAFEYDYKTGEHLYRARSENPTIELEGNFIPYQDPPPPKEPQKDDLPPPLDLVKVVEETPIADAQPATYAILLCPPHGEVGLTELQYKEQLSKNDDPWVCPVCLKPAHFKRVEDEEDNIPF